MSFSWALESGGRSRLKRYVAVHEQVTVAKAEMGRQVDRAREELGRRKAAAGKKATDWVKSKLTPE